MRVSHGYRGPLFRVYMKSVCRREMRSGSRERVKELAVET